MGSAQGAGRTIGGVGIAALLAATGCAHPPRPTTGDGTATGRSEPSPAGTAGGSTVKGEATPPLQVLAWARLANAAPLVQAVARVGGLRPAPGEEPAVARALFGQLIGLDPALGAALDLGRPAVMALLRPDTSDGSDAGPPILALLPVVSREAVVSGAASAGLQVEPTSWGVILRPGSTGPGAPSSAPDGQPGATPPATPALPPAAPPGAPPAAPPAEPPAAEPEPAAFIAFTDDRYAAVAFREDRARHAIAVLMPIVRARAEAPLTAHLDVARLFEAWGGTLERTLSRFARVTQSATDPQIAYALRGARRFLRFADSIEGVDFLLDADAQGVTVTARADGLAGGAFAAHVAAQQTGAPWGLELLPRDAVLVYATRRSTQAAADELDDAVELLGDAATPPAEAPQRAAWREALGRAGAEMPGEMVYAVWPAAATGGIGVGGAWRVRPGPVARRETIAAYRRIGDRMAGVVARSLRLDPQRFRLHVRVLPASLRIGAAVADAVEVTVRWPPGAAAERRLLRALVGEPLRMVVAFDGERALFAMGSDAQPRLSAMLAAARGHGAATLADDPRLRAALAFRPEARVSLSFLPTAPMAGMLARMLHGAMPNPSSTAAVEAALAEAGDGAIVATTNASGRRYEVSTRLPGTSLPGLPRIGGVLWRMALSPLLNPPAMPPLPLPPAHLRPQAPPRRSASAPSQQL